MTTANAVPKVVSLSEQERERDMDTGANTTNFRNPANRMATVNEEAQQFSFKLSINLLFHSPSRPPNTLTP